MTRRLLVAVLLLAAIALFVIRLWPKGAEPAPRPAKAAIAGASVAEEAARKEATKRLAQLPPAMPHVQVDKFSAELIQSAEEAFRGMISVRGLIIQDQERRALAQQLLGMPDGRELMRETILNLEFAKAAFGEFQAEARFYAIYVLKEAARQGNLDIVVETSAGLMGQLAAVAGEPDLGRAEDLMAIVAIVGERLGSDGLTDAHDPMLTRLGCTPGLAKEVRALCLRGLFQGVWAADGIQEAQSVLDRLRTP